MNISVIIPILNEAERIDALLSQLADLPGDFEVLFGDGGSRDGTIEKIGTAYPVIACPRGRAKQMNQAAEQSKGTVLFFLHCDSVLPKNAIEQIEEKINASYEFGCFRLRFDSDRVLMKCCGFLSNMRVRWRKIAFGDQGIFMTRRLFDEIGGFPDLPLMEDYRLSIMLKKKYPLGQTKAAITTSARRFEEGGILRTMCKMQLLQAMFRHGADSNEIAARYRSRRENM